MQLDLQDLQDLREQKARKVTQELLDHRVYKEPLVRKEFKVLQDLPGRKASKGIQV